MREITFDIETANTLPALSRSDLSQLELSIVGIHDSETGEYSSYTKEELPLLWPIMERADVLIGFNSDYFDIPILNRYYPGDLSKIRSLDLLVEVQKVLGRRIRLQSLAEATLNKGKGGDGLKAVEWWQKGEVEKVREYCIEDVRITRQIYEYAIENNALKYKDLKQTREMKIDASSWRLSGEGTSLTHTLPL
ncbi:ribonuclease H-like domain-containing protein [Patescibacteria group bacterium]|nr:ribonuclease H-like domain-containing protein [Patescibacteria group bacterium]MBU1754758.1 ribonuclease H-like domain-containing protein [Patescibacteria group bacterium]